MGRSAETVPKPVEHEEPIEQLVARAVEARVGEIEGRIMAALDEIRKALPEERAVIVLFSGDLDKALSAMVIATGAAAMGLQVTVYFTFWGLNLLRKEKILDGKSLMERLLALMSPAGTEAAGLSQMNFFGLGAAMLRRMMREKQITSLEELLGLARELEVRMIACAMSMDAMGIRPEELVDGLDFGGVATFLGEATRAKVSLFI